MCHTSGVQGGGEVVRRISRSCSLVDLGVVVRGEGLVVRREDVGGRREGARKRHSWIPGEERRRKSAIQSTDGGQMLDRWGSEGALEQAGRTRAVRAPEASQTQKEVKELDRSYSSGGLWDVRFNMSRESLLPAYEDAEKEEEDIDKEEDENQEDEEEENQEDKGKEDEVDPESELDKTMTDDGGHEDHSWTEDSESSVRLCDQKLDQMLALMRRSRRSIEGKE